MTDTTVFVTFKSDIDDEGNDIYKTTEIPLKTYILLKAKSNRNSASHVIFANKTIKQKRRIILTTEKPKGLNINSKEFDEILENFVEERTEEKLLELFEDFVCVSKANYLHAGMDKKTLSNLIRSGKLMKIKSSYGKDFHKFYNFSLKRYCYFRKTPDYFSTIKNRREWFREGRAVNEDILKKMRFTEDSFTYSPARNANNEKRMSKLFFEDKLFFDFSDTHEISDSEKAEFEKELLNEEKIKKDRRNVLSRKYRLNKKLKNELHTHYEWLENGRELINCKSDYCDYSIFTDKTLFPFSETEDLEKMHKRFLPFGDTYDLFKTKFIIKIAFRMKLSSEETVKSIIAKKSIPEFIDDFIKSGRKISELDKDYTNTTEWLEFSKFHENLRKELKKESKNSAEILSNFDCLIAEDIPF